MLRGAAILPVILTACIATDREWPAPVGSTRAYRCADGYRFVARFEPERVWLFFSDETRSLPQVPAIGGVLYTDGARAFRARGDDARLERETAIHANCRNEPARVAWESAWLAGVNLRATGNAPFWSLEVDDGSSIVFTTEGSPARHFPASIPKREESTTTYMSAADGRSIRIEARDIECADVTSGERFALTVRVLLDSREYQGCGRRVK